MSEVRTTNVLLAAILGVLVFVVAGVITFVMVLHDQRQQENCDSARDTYKAALALHVDADDAQRLWEEMQDACQ